MEDLQPISAPEQEYFCVELMNRLNMQRKQDYLCDITLVTKDDKEVKAHKNVLSAASPFFCKLLQSDMKENREGIVRFKEISGSVMEDVLEFIYTGTVTVTQENAKELIAAANYFLIPSLKTASGRFLEVEMSDSNCISTFYFAEKYDCEELISNSRRFIHENFSSVAEMDEFLSLEAKEVERWISSDEISVEAEADVFKIIVTRVEQNKSERKAAFEELFRHVRVVFISRDCLEDVVTNELVRENSTCVWQALKATVKMATFADEDYLSQSPRKGLNTRVIVACGGKNSFCYLPEGNQWKLLPDVLSDKGCYTRMIKFRDQMLTFQEYENIEKYDPVFNEWSELKLMFAISSKVAVVQGKIYVVETKTFGEPTCTVKRYNVERSTWDTVLSSHDRERCRKDACVVAAGDGLYVFGGKLALSSQYIAKAERFDTVENKWEEIADMQQARGGSFGVATHEKIFVAGGTEEGGILKTCEMYSISTNEWQLVGSLNVPRLYGSMVCLNGKLYVLGGRNENQRSELKVECFDTENDKWIQKTSIPVAKIAKGNKDTFTGCVLRLSRGLLDRLSVVG